MYTDSDLHLFVTDDEIYETVNLWPMEQTLRRDSKDAVLRPDGQSEGTALGYASSVWDEEGKCYKIWYNTHVDLRIFLAVSSDGFSWEKKGIVGDPRIAKGIDNMQVTVPSPGLDPWFDGARFVGTCYYIGSGIHVMRSMDGESWESRENPVLPGIGDRSGLVYDPVRQVYMFTSRPPYFLTKGIQTSRPRKIALWESRDLIHFEYVGIVLRADEKDQEDAEMYGMVPFRYGKCYFGLLEMYYPNIERLDTQLAFSRDGRYWERMPQRKSILGLGGEGSWDSHWVVPTLNSPILKDGRFVFFYSATSTKHASGVKHRRAVGIASLRKDGWVSMEAGRKEGQLVTTLLPVHKPMRLEVNVSCPTGYFSVEVLASDGYPLSGYQAEDSRIEGIDDCKYRVQWKGSEIINLSDLTSCMLRFRLYQGSFFSYRWVVAE